MIRKIRNGVFETNSSSTHALVYNSKENYDFLSPSRQLIIDFVDTDDDTTYDTLRDSIKRIEFWLYHTTFDGQMMESEVTMNSELKLYHSLKEIN